MSKKTKNGYIVYVIVDGEQQDRVDIDFDEFKAMGFRTQVKHTDKVCFLDEAIAERLFKYS